MVETEVQFLYLFKICFCVWLLNFIKCTSYFYSSAWTGETLSVFHRSSFHIMYLKALTILFWGVVSTAETSTYIPKYFVFKCVHMSLLLCFSSTLNCLLSTHTQRCAKHFHLFMSFSVHCRKLRFGLQLGLTAQTWWKGSETKGHCLVVSFSLCKAQCGAWAVLQDNTEAVCFVFIGVTLQFLTASLHISLRWQHIFFSS